MADLQLKKCPVCRARFKGGEPLEQPCHRCDSDLQYIRAAHLHAQHWQNKARFSLHNQQPIQAVAAAKQALAYVDTTSTRQTLAATLINANLPDLAQQILQP